MNPHLTSSRPAPLWTPSRRGFLLGTGGALVLTACGSGGSSGGSGGAGTLSISAIPDQDPELLTRLYGGVADRFSDALGQKVAYKPLTEYPAVVRGFELGDIYLSWMGGLTGVQATARVPGAVAIAQRDIDADFHSLFIANKSAGLKRFDDEKGLLTLAGHSFTFGSETSTSGRLMPNFFMDESGLDLKDLKGKPGFSGSHDATIEAVASGSFETGAVNEQVWKSTVDEGKVDLSDVGVLWRTPGYHDYHWLARPDIDEKFGSRTQDKIKDLLFGLDESVPKDAEVLKLFGAKKFVPTENSNYDQIRKAAKALGLLA